MYHYKEENTTEFKSCDAPGCTEHAEHRAPKSRDDTPDYYWFCLEHVREYNKAWNYFSGMSQEEIEQFQKDATLGHRPTWQHQVGTPLNEQALHAKLRSWWAGEPQTSAFTKPINAKHQKALDKLSLTHPSTLSEIKTQYKKLVKQYHPDVNQGDKSAEDRFKSITSAYHLLIEDYACEAHS